MYYLKSNRLILLLAGILTLAVSCNKDTDTRALYNIDSLLNSQVEFLTTEQAKLHKIASVRGQKEDSLFIPKDSASWSAELDIFRELEMINKPVNRDSYIVDDELWDPSSNLTVKAISAIDDMQVKYVRIFYQQTLDKPRKIEALYRDENELFKSERVLTMGFQQINNKTILTSYSVKGGQKMIMGDSVSFLIEGEITID